MNVKVITQLNTKDVSDYYTLRWNLLRKPWNQALGSEKDELEGDAFHVLVRNYIDQAIGVGRLHFINIDVAQIRYMGVHESYRNQGVGRIILSCLESEAKNKKAKEIILYARETAIQFYQKSDFNILRESHILFGEIKHYLLIKKLFSCDE